MIRQDLKSWSWGHADGLQAKPNNPPAHLCAFSYSSGYVEGWAERRKTAARLGKVPETPAKRFQ